MTCDDAVSRLDEYVDEELGAAERRELEAHLTTCPSCRGEEQRLRELLQEAARLPKQIAPPRDLWPGIAARLAPRTARRPRLVIPWLPALAAAMLLVALSSGLTAVLMQRGKSEDAAATLRVAPVVELRPAAVEEVASSLREVEIQYERASQALLASLEQRRDQVSTETLEIVQQNLQTIDAALDEVRKALAQDPGNAGLMRMLASTHQKKIDVLQRVIRHRTPLVG